MQLDDAAAGEVARRLRRVEGQLGGVIKMIEDGRECAISSPSSPLPAALDRAGFRLLSAGMRQCITAAARASPRAMSPEQLERLFLSLA
jgi:DNA-binding FrmR family transcriptional regulator